MAQPNGTGAVDHDARNEIRGLQEWAKGHDRLCEERDRNQQTAFREFRMSLGQNNETLMDTKGELLSAFSKTETNLRSLMALTKSDTDTKLAKLESAREADKARVDTLESQNNVWKINLLMKIVAAAGGLILMMAAAIGYLITHGGLHLPT